MKTVTASILRIELKKHLDLVSKSFQTIIIPRNKMEEAVIMMPLSEYNALSETNYLLSSKANRKRLKESIEQVEKGKTTEFEL